MERVSFLDNGSLPSSRSASEVKRTTSRYSFLYTLILLVAASILLGILRMLHLTEGDVVPKVQFFTCPAVQSTNTTYDGGEDFEDVYAKISRNITTSKKEFLETFRETPYDGWSATYTATKAIIVSFKSKYFVPNLKPGMKIYESAFGIGLNLFMTLEVLQEFTNTLGITVYGNEYVPESVEKANFILGEGVIPLGNQKGVLCAGDSMNLSHVPSNSFDLVYTGYITPHQNTLDIDEDDDDKWDQICDGASKHQWMAEKLKTISTQRQEDWYGKWVGEMARIAKPGAPVIVEEVSQPFCVVKTDWDGVSRSFWHDAAKKNTYDWNIDPESIEMMDHRKTRYCVFMRKRNAI